MYKGSQRTGQAKTAASMIEWGQVDCELAAYQHHKQDILLLKIG